jgi:hypothetical protein
VGRHIRRYVETDGRSGHRWSGVRTLLADRFSARALTATAAEKPRLWRLMASVWPDYDRYQAKTERDNPVVILERRVAG